MTTQRISKALAVLLAALVGLSATFVPQAVGQGSVVGSADFRNAPQLLPGEYVDRIVTGDTAWYSVIYTNNTPYEFEVSFRGVDPGRDATLSVSFVAPTLTTVNGPSRLVTGSGVEYPAGHTNVWFLKVSLSTTGQAGLEYPILIRATGIQSVGTEPCADTPGCSLDDEYASNNVALADATAALETLRAQETLERVESELENLRGFAESDETVGPAALARLGRAEATLAGLCAPDPTCDEFPDPGSKTPLVGWIFGLAALGLGAYRAFKRFTKQPTDEAAKPPPRQPVSSARPRAKK